MANPAPAPGTERPDLQSRWFDARNRMLGRSEFQRWASTFPLTRKVAQGRAGGLFDLCAGFVYSQILFACVELKLFEKLVGGPVEVDALAAQCGLEPAAMTRLLEAAAPLDLVEKHGDGYGLGVHGAAYLGNPGVGAMIAHHTMLYRDLADPVALLKGTKGDTELSKFWPYATADDPKALEGDAVAPYSELMSTSLAHIADDVLDAYPASHAHLLDIGGGAGDFLVAAANRRPDMQVTLFDLPAVAQRADARFARERLSGRAKAVGGDFKHDPLPEGADVISLVRVAHDLEDADLDALLGKIGAVLPPGGILLLAEPLAESPGAEKVGSYFAMYLLAMQRGRLRTEADLTRRLYAAGFARVRCTATARPLLTSLLVAQKSAGIRNRAVRRD